MTGTLPTMAELKSVFKLKGTKRKSQNCNAHL